MRAKSRSAKVIWPLGVRFSSFSRLDVSRSYFLMCAMVGQSREAGSTFVIQPSDPDEQQRKRDAGERPLCGESKVPLLESCDTAGKITAIKGPRCYVGWATSIIPPFPKVFTEEEEPVDKG